MKPLFIFCCLFLTLKSKATNDTLTRAQVYNFNLGDTFDYRLDYSGYGVELFNDSSYIRIVISSKYYSQNQDTLFYGRIVYATPNNQVHTTPVMRDTISIDSLQLDAIAYDTYKWRSFIYGFPSDSFNNRTVNQVYLSTLEGSEAQIYAIGLGEVYDEYGGGDPTEEVSDSTITLIYYSQAGQTWGTPANLAVGIPNIPQQNPSITLFPTINNSQFKISINDANNSCHQLIIYDLTGREVKRTNVTSGTNDIALDNASPGMYLWSVTSQGTILKSGKLIIQ